MGVEVTHDVGANSAFARRLMEEVGRKQLAKMQSIGNIACAIADNYVNDDLKTREGRRHKKNGHLVGSFSATVEGSTFPFTIKMTSSKEDAAVAALEYGSRPHTITARNVPLLVFPHSKTGRRVATPQVNHPGHRPGYKIMERALENTIARQLNVSRRRVRA